MVYVLGAQNGLLFYPLTPSQLQQAITAHLLGLVDELPFARVVHRNSWNHVCFSAVWKCYDGKGKTNPMKREKERRQGKMRTI